MMGKGLVKMTVTMGFVTVFALSALANGGIKVTNESCTKAVGMLCGTQSSYEYAIEGESIICNENYSTVTVGGYGEDAIGIGHFFNDCADDKVRNVVLGGGVEDCDVMSNICE